ncbi:MAG TPA: Clp protease N-terminal domain-containing protein [Actinomycetota bacterium]|nr:Clp protease N-terminal domain-containing protein [Actinomycetota bacterium]
MDEFVAATEPEGGWRGRPWDHRFVPAGDGNEVRIAVDDAGRPVLDEDGDMILSGPGLGHVPHKVHPVGFPASVVQVSLDGLDADARQAVEGAVEVATDFGHPWVGTEHLVVSILRNSPEVAARVRGLPDVSSIERAIAEFYEGAEWRDARLEKVASRREGRRPRPPRPDPPPWNHALDLTLDRARAMAKREDRPEAGVEHLLIADMLGDRCLSLMLLERVGVDVGPVRQRLSELREWRQLLQLVVEAESAPEPS